MGRSVFCLENVPTFKDVVSKDGPDEKVVAVTETGRVMPEAPKIRQAFSGLVLSFRLQRSRIVERPTVATKT